MWHNVSDVFQSPSTLKARLQESFLNDVPKELDFRCGYFHGNSKQWIFEENDLKTMYKLFPSGSNITIWCDALVVDVAQQSSKKRKCEGDSLNDEIFKNLKDKNPEMTSPKLRLWAKLIERGHYDSYDQPPDIPLIAGGHSDKKTVHQSLSPMKSAQLRRAYLEDLKSLKSLKDDGVLSDEEFVAEKKKVLSSPQSLT